jgi:hypothetical protein
MYTPTPTDCHDPDWGGVRRVHDWKNYIYQSMRDAWETFSSRQQELIATNAQEIADMENWD